MDPAADRRGAIERSPSPRRGEGRGEGDTASFAPRRLPGACLDAAGSADLTYLRNYEVNNTLRSKSHVPTSG